MAEAPGAAAGGSVRVGAYSLEVAGSGSFAHFEPEQERQNARDLRGALDEAADEPPAPVAAIEEFQESAEAVTSRIEEADRLLRTAASGGLLQVGNLSGEIDSLLDLFTRLDKAGRFEEELKLMRSLNGLLALTLRWLDLIRSLLALLSSARASGHKAGQAFAHHELGSLKLCAGRPEEAAKDLDEALRLEDAAGDGAGRCATKHNLDSARRDALRRGGWGHPRRIQRLVILAGAIAIAAGSGAGIALAIHGAGGNGATTSTSPPTTPKTGDAQAPTTPTGLTAKPVSASEIDLAWSPSTDNIGVTGYVIYRDDTKLTAVNGTTTSYRDTSLAASTAYAYRVQAIDRAGNRSARSSLARARTPAAADTQAPTAPTGLQAAAVSTSEIDLSWAASTDNVAVTEYVVYRNGKEVDRVSGATTTYQDTGLTESTTYTYTVRALDAAGNISGTSASATATTQSSLQ